jgi:hypothetical protein
MHGPYICSRRVASRRIRNHLPLAPVGLFAALIPPTDVLAQSKESAMARQISYRTVRVDGLSIFLDTAADEIADLVRRFMTGF